MIFIANVFSRLAMIQNVLFYTFTTFIKERQRNGNS